ncbi:MAG: twin-arginine translocase subunit TatC [Spirochaetes bacterium]|nr:twin-arginine translocase subunit TatC [Spirochaetota bacterium]
MKILDTGGDGNRIHLLNNEGDNSVAGPRKRKPVTKSAGKKSPKTKITAKKKAAAASSKKKAKNSPRGPASGRRTSGVAAPHRKNVKSRTLKDYEVSENASPRQEEVDPEALDRGDVPMTVVGHLEELRSRIIISLAVLVILTVAAFVFSEQILDFINRPFTDTGLKLNVFKLTEGFIIRLKVSAIAALMAGLPFFVFQVWRFILPAITKGDRMFTRLSLLASIFLFYGGMVFVFFGLVPFAVKVMLGFVTPEMMSTIGANDYVSFVLLFCVLMGVLFEFPIVVMVLTRIGILTPSFLITKRKYAIVLIFVLSAVITPTQDVLTMLIVSLPLIFLYEISIMISRFTVVRKKRKALGA